MAVKSIVHTFITMEHWHARSNILQCCQQVPYTYVKALAFIYFPALWMAFNQVRTYVMYPAFNPSKYLALHVREAHICTVFEESFYSSK